MSSPTLPHEPDRAPQAPRGTGADYETKHARRERLKASGTCCACGRLRANRGTLCTPCAEKNTANNKAARDRARAKGWCPRCSARPVAPDAKYCAICIEAIAVIRARDAERTARGQCRVCGATAAAAQLCRAHADQANRTRIELKRRRVAEGNCWKCGTPARPGMLTCAPCAARLRTRTQGIYARRRAAGQCTDCGTPIPESRFIRCAPCRAIRVQQRRAAR